jgi:hypothetical protein
VAELQGHRFDARTKDMIERLIWKTGLDLVISQGSYNTSVGASGGTHAGGGAVDLSVRNLSLAQQAQVVLIGRQIGFAIWIRQPIPGVWTKHIHGIAINCADLSNAAEQQVRAYHDGRNGLANNGPDDGPDGYRQNTWERWNAAHPDEEFLMSLADDFEKRLAAIEARVKSNTDARAQYAYAAVTEGGGIDKRLDLVEGRVEPNTNARAQYAYDKVLELGPAIDTLTANVAELTKKVAALPK